MIYNRKDYLPSDKLANTFMQNLLFFNDDGLPLNRALIQDGFERYFSSRVFLPEATTDTPSQLSLYVLDAQSRVPAANALSLQRWQRYSLGRVSVRSNSELAQDFIDSDTPEWNGWPVSTLTPADRALDWLSVKRLNSVEINEHFIKDSAVWLRVYESDLITPVDASLFPDYEWTLDNNGDFKPFKILSVQQDQVLVDTDPLGNGQELQSFLDQLQLNNHVLLCYPLSLLEFWPDEYDPVFQKDITGFPKDLVDDNRTFPFFIKGDNRPQQIPERLEAIYDDRFALREIDVEKYELGLDEIESMSLLRAKVYDYRQTQQCYRGTLTWSVDRPSTLVFDGGIRQQFTLYDRFWIRVWRQRVAYDLVEKNHQNLGFSNGVMTLDSPLIDNVSTLPADLQDSIREALGYESSKVITLQDFAQYLEDPFVFVTCHKWITSDVSLTVPNTGLTVSLQQYADRFNSVMDQVNLSWSCQSTSQGLSWSRTDAYSNSAIEIYDDQTAFLQYDTLIDDYNLFQGSLTQQQVKPMLIDQPLAYINTDISPRQRHAERLVEIYDLDVQFANTRGFWITINGVRYKTQTSQPDLAGIVQDWFDQWSEVLKHRGVAVSINIVNTDSSLIGKRNRVRLHFYSRFPDQPLSVDIDEPVFARWAVAYIEDWIDHNVITAAVPDEIGLNIEGRDFTTPYVMGQSFSDTFVSDVLLPNKAELNELTVSFSQEDSGAEAVPLAYAETSPVAAYWNQLDAGDDINVQIDLIEPVGAGTEFGTGTARLIIWTSLDRNIDVSFSQNSVGIGRVKPFYTEQSGLSLTHHRLYSDNSFALRDRGLDRGREIAIESEFYPYSDGVKTIDSVRFDYTMSEYLLLNSNNVIDGADWSDGPTGLDFIYPLLTPKPDNRDNVPIDPDNPTVESGVPEALVSLGDGANSDSWVAIFEVLARQPAARTDWLEYIDWVIKPESEENSDFNTDNQTNDFFLIDIEGDQINLNLTQQPGSIPYKGRQPLWADVPRNLKGRFDGNRDKPWNINPYRQRTIFNRVRKTLRIPDGTAQDWVQVPQHITVGYFPQREGPHQARLKGYYVKELSFDITPSVTGDNYWELNAESNELVLTPPVAKSFVQAGVSVGDRIKIKSVSAFETVGQPAPAFMPFVIRVKTVTDYRLTYEVISGTPQDQLGQVADDFFYRLILENVPQQIVDFQLLGQSEAEDPRLLDLNQTFRPEVDNVDLYAVRSYDVDQWGQDYRIFNEKRKEILETRTEIEHYIGGYRSIINSVYLFEHTELEWFEFMLDVREESPTFGKLMPFELEGFFDPLVPGWRDQTLKPGKPGSQRYLKKTDQAVLSYRITDDQGRTTNDYRLKQVLVQLGLLKAWLVRQVIPLNIYLKEVAGRHQSMNPVRVNESTTQVVKIPSYDEVSPVLIQAEAYMNPLTKNRHTWIVKLSFVPPVDDFEIDHWVLKVSTYSVDDSSIPLDPGFDPVRRDAGTEMVPIQQIKETRHGDDFSSYQFVLDQQLDSWAVVECWVFNGWGAGYVSRYVLQVEDQLDYDA